MVTAKAQFLLKQKAEARKPNKYKKDKRGN
jgi:hypothetical protein